MPHDHSNTENPMVRPEFTLVPACVFEQHETVFDETVKIELLN